MMRRILTMVFAVSCSLPGQTSDQPSGDGVSLLLGMGARILGTRDTNYKTTSSNVLETTNLGRATPQAVAGLGFAFCGSDAGPKTKVKSEEGTPHWFCANQVTSKLSAFVAPTFGSGGSDTLSGFTIGVGFHASKVLHLLVGYSMTPLNEVTPGFQKAASQYVAGHSSQYPGLDPVAMAGNKPNAFDGFQYVIPPGAGATGLGTAIYPGDPLTTHNRSGLFIGVAFPVNLITQLQGKSQSPSAAPAPGQN
jgi:hypothetical protein